MQPQKIICCNLEYMLTWHRSRSWRSGQKCRSANRHLLTTPSNLQPQCKHQLQSLGSITYTECKNVCSCYRWSVCLSVCLSGHSSKPYKNRWTDWNAVHVVEPYATWGPESPKGKGQYWKLLPTLECIRLHNVAARGCRLVCRGQCITDKSTASERTHQPRVDKCRGNMAFAKILWPFVSVITTCAYLMSETTLKKWRK